MARKRKGRILNGIIVINKPKGLTSNQALQKIKRLFNAQKAGHTGSLDPMATGVLPICFGQATRISQYLLDADKSYQATIQLGKSTTTGDTEGDVIKQSPVLPLNAERIGNALSQFRGAIHQIPPMFSALKHQGVPLYKLAREGIEIERKSRQVTIYTLELESYDDINHTIDINVTCSKGTYIRTLGMDIGIALGTDAHLTRLVRTQCGLLTESNMQNVDDFQTLTDDQVLNTILPTELAFTDQPIISIPLDKLDLFYSKGKFISSTNLTGIGRIYNQERFVALGYFEQGEMIKKQLFTQGILYNE